MPRSRREWHGSEDRSETVNGQKNVFKHHPSLPWRGQHVSMKKQHIIKLHSSYKTFDVFPKIAIAHLSTFYCFLFKKKKKTCG